MSTAEGPETKSAGGDAKRDAKRDDDRDDDDDDDDGDAAGKRPRSTEARSK
jgi:hypothetical protein